MYNELEQAARESIITMEDRDIFDEMVAILSTYARDKESLGKATLETNIISDLKVNSARIVDVIIRCEDTFGVRIEDEDTGRIGRIGDAVLLIKNLKAAAEY